MDEFKERPRFRPAQSISELEAKEAFNSGDVERIHYALVDGSRCLSDDFIYPFAVAFLNHEKTTVRWAAAFAIGQCRSTIGPRLKQDFEPIHTLAGLAASDDSANVRQLAAQALADFVSELLR